MLGFPHHLDLSVQSMSDSSAFYDRVLCLLGYRRSEAYAGDVPCWVHQAPEAPTFSIGVHQAAEGLRHHRFTPGLHHLAFAATSRREVDAFFAFPQEHQISVLDPPAEYDYTPGYYAVFFKDPNGIKLEVVFEPGSV